MASMRIGPYRRLGPDLTASGIYQGTIYSPYIIGAPTSARRPFWPPVLRGRHVYKTLPRPLSWLPPDPTSELPVAAGRLGPSGPMDAGYTFGQYGPESQYLGQAPIVGDPQILRAAGEVAARQAAAADDHQKETRASFWTLMAVMGGVTILLLATSPAPKKRRA